jgi:hypothetical protein
MQPIKSNLQEALKHDRFRQVPIPKGYKLWDGHDEDEELTSEETNNHNIAGLAFGISYPTMPNQVRPVTLLRFYNTNDSTYFIGRRCHVRKKYRTFRVDRISQLVDLQTGEVIDNPLEYLLQNFILTENPNNKNLKSDFQQKLLDLQYDLQLLAYVGWCDGSFSDPEQLACLAFIRESIGRLSMEDEDNAMVFIQKINPDSISFLSAAQKVFTSAARKERVIKFANRLVQSDDEITADEMNLIVELANL